MTPQQSVAPQKTPQQSTALQKTPQQSTAPQKTPQQSTASKPINGQKLCEYANISFGWCRFGHNGCVVLSIYNALLRSGYDCSVKKVHSMLHRPWRPRFLGVRVGEIRRCLRKLQIPFREFSSGRTLAASMVPGDVAILMRWNRTVPYIDFTMGKEPLSVLRFPDPFDGAHGVAVEYSAPGKWLVYNRYSNRDRVYEYTTLEEFLSFETAFMAGFLIAKGERSLEE
ncbi:MAG: hypothetical protein IKM59_05300 [Oscillospiraceae bacterium]|nr:hypothetical protein [Oscillospiraceae bacterium]